MATWSYQVKYVYDNSEGSPFVTPVDITDNVITIENMTDIGTGEVNTAVLQLNARDGNFITDTNSGATPLINQFDRIYIKLTDKNSAVYDRVFEVDSLEQKKTITDGIRLVINLMGLERHLQQVHFAKQYFYTSAFDLSKDVIDRYNTSAGIKQVDVEKQDTVSSGSGASEVWYNELPKWTANNMDFGVSETYCYDGINELLNKMGSSISAGGAGDFFEFTFEDDSTISNNKLFFHAFKSGDRSNQDTWNGSAWVEDIPVITNPTNTLPIYSTSGELENETGTVIFAKGAKGYGSMPTNTSKFRSYKEEFDLIPAWQTGESYPTGARVTYINAKYQANTQTSTSWVGGEWDLIRLGNIAGNMVYSPFTSSLTEMTSGDGGNDGGDGYKLMTSSGTNPDDTTADHGTSTSAFTWHGCWDGNLVIRDEDHFRTWVDCAELSPGAIPSELLMSSAVYRGFRVLVNGTGSGDFSGYNNRIMQYDGSEWKQFYPFNAGATPQTDAQCAVINIGKNYKWSGSTWTTTDFNIDKANDCFHPTTKVFSEDGIATALKSTGAAVSTIKYGTKSASVWQYQFSVFDSIIGAVATLPNYYQIGGWACFRVPYPTTSDNLPAAPLDTVGSLYVNPTIDQNNMHLTPSGLTGFNASDSDELGICDALSFFIKFKYYFMHAISGDEVLIPFTGKFKFRCTCYDSSDNVVTQDFTVAFNEEWEYISLPISSFKIYRARVTRRWGNIASNLIVPDLEVTEVFEWKNLKMISIQCQESYDDNGRFAAEEGQLNSAWNLVTIGALNSLNQRTRLSLDNLHFTKQLTATSGTDTSRNIEPIFMERPYTTNFKQLESDAISQFDIEKFRYESFEIETEGECPDNLRFGDSFYLVDTDVVNVALADRTGDEAINKIKLVAKRIEYVINGTDGGRGGFVRKILGVKRITV